MKRFTLPPVGSVVTVVTRYKEIYYYSDNEWRDIEYKGKVLPPDPWLTTNEFKISCDESHMTSRVINLKNVIKLIVENQELTTEEFESSTIYRAITGSKGAEYTVTITNGIAVSCTCPGFTYRHRCRHLKEAVDLNTEDTDNMVTKT